MLPGAYVLAIELAKPITVRIRTRSRELLVAGRYLYCGSARGPGGLRARIARHMRHGKAIRWHIDNLTEAGRLLGAWTFVGGHECELVAALAHLPAPVDGFGSSDCRYCRSDLLRCRNPEPHALRIWGSGVRNLFGGANLLVKSISHVGAFSRDNQRGKLVAYMSQNLPIERRANSLRSTSAGGRGTGN